MSARADSAPRPAPTGAAAPSWRDFNAAGLRHAQDKAWPDAARAFAQAAQLLGTEGKAVLRTRDAEARGSWGNAFALVLANLAQAEYQRGRLAAAITAAERSLDVRLKTGAPGTRAVARVRGDLAVLLTAARRHADAARVLDDGLAAVTDAGARLTLLEHRGRVAVHARDAGAAPSLAARLREALAGEGPTSAAASRVLAQLDALTAASVQPPVSAIEATDAAREHPPVVEPLVIASPAPAGAEMEPAAEVAPPPVASPAVAEAPPEPVEDAHVLDQPSAAAQAMPEPVADEPPLPEPPPAVPLLPDAPAAALDLDAPFEIFPAPTPAFGVAVVPAAVAEPPAVAPVAESPALPPVASAAEEASPLDGEPGLVGAATALTANAESSTLAVPDAALVPPVECMPGASVTLDGFGDVAADEPAAPVVEATVSRGEAIDPAARAPDTPRARSGTIDAVPPTAATRPHVMRSLEHFFDEFGRPQSGKSATVEDPDERYDGLARVTLTPIPSVLPAPSPVADATTPSDPAPPRTPTPAPEAPTAARTIALDDEIFGGASFDIVVPTPPEPAPRTTGSHDVGTTPPGLVGVPLPPIAPTAGAPDQASPALRPSMTLGFVVEHGLPTQVDYEAPPPPDVVLPADPGGSYMPKPIGARDITMGNRRPDGSIVIQPAEADRATVPKGSAIIPDVAEPPGLAPRRAEPSADRRPAQVTPTGAPVAEVEVRARRGGTLAARHARRGSNRVVLAVAAVAAVAAAVWFVVLPALRA